jgi:hypothetical protein
LAVHLSIPRNQSIARVFSFMQWLDVWGKVQLRDISIWMSSADYGAGWSHEDTKKVGDSIRFHPLTTLTRTRYSEFEDLHQKLVQTFPHAVSSMPQFPPKSVICKSHALVATPLGRLILTMMQ